MNFSNKKVIITGASRGIGKSIARAFKLKGANVFGTSTSNKFCDKYICDEWVIEDFTELQQIHKCVDIIKIIEPDILVNNAGINKISSFLDIKFEDFLSIQQVNLHAPFLITQAVIPYMVKKKWGRIINISSIWGKISKEFRASYSSSKFALDGLTLSIAAEYSKNGILANCIAPGFIDTDLTRQMLSEEQIQSLVSLVPIKRLGKVEEIVKFVLWLSSEENTFITGQNISIDGGFSRV